MRRSATNEMVPFRLIQMPCCKTQVCWINPRLPTHCPECGQPVYKRLRFGPDHCILDERTGWLRLQEVK